MSSLYMCFFFFNYTATTEIYTYGHTLSLHDALPICFQAFAPPPVAEPAPASAAAAEEEELLLSPAAEMPAESTPASQPPEAEAAPQPPTRPAPSVATGGTLLDRKSTRLNTSH